MTEEDSIDLQSLRSESSVAKSSDVQSSVDFPVCSELPQATSVSGEKDNKLESLYASVILPGPSWSDQSQTPLMSIQLCKLGQQATPIGQSLLVTHCLTISRDLTWTLYVHNHEVDARKCTALNSVLHTLDQQSLASLLDKLDSLNICSGHPDTHFVSMLKDKKGKVLSSQGNVVACVDNYAPIILNGEVY